MMGHLADQAVYRLLSTLMVLAPSSSLLHMKSGQWVLWMHILRAAGKTVATWQDGPLTFNRVLEELNRVACSMLKKQQHNIL